MGLILVKKAGVELPPKEKLISYYKENDSGVGYMFVKDNKVIIHKGFYRFIDFYKDFLENYSKDIPMVIYFRKNYIANSVVKRADQPYVVANNVNESDCYVASCDNGFVHDGYISKLSKYNTDISDSLLFGVDYLNLIVDNKEWYKDCKNVELVNKLIGDYNTIAIMSSDGHIELIGKFFTKDGVALSKDV